MEEQQRFGKVLLILHGAGVIQICIHVILAYEYCRIGIVVIQEIE